MQTQNETSHKKSPRKGKAKESKFTQAEVDAMLAERENQLKEELEEKVRAEMSAEHGYTDDTDDSPGLFSTGGGEDQGHDHEPEDIFISMQNGPAQKGALVQYAIKKDGHFVGEVYHPFSWAEVQSQFGGGHFTVIARDGNSKQYIKQQTQLVKAAPKAEAPQSQQPAQQVQQPAQFNPNVLIDFVARMQELNKGDEKSVAREEAKSNTTIMTHLLTSQQQSQQQITDLIFKMQQSTMEVIKASSEQSQKMMESMRTEFARILESGSKKKEELGPLELMKMLAEERKAGREDMKFMFDMAESLKEEKEDAGEPKSAIGSLISGVLPLLSTVNTQMQQQPVALPPVAPARPVQPRSVPPAVRQQSTAGPQAANHQRPPARVIRPTPAQSPTQKVVSPTAGVSRPASPTAPKAVTPTVVAQPQQSIEEMYANATTIQKRMIESVLPLIAAPLQMGLAPEVGARNVYTQITGWKDKDLTPEALLKEFPLDLAQRIAAYFGMNSPNYSQWLKEFYANFKVTVDANAALANEPKPTNGIENSNEASDNIGRETGQPANS